MGLVRRTPGESIRCELTLESGDRTVLRGLADVSVDEGPP